MRPPTVTPVDSGSMLARSTVQGASEAEITGTKKKKMKRPHKNIFILEILSLGDFEKVGLKFARFL